MVRTWTNWAGTARATPAHMVRPHDAGEIASAITDAVRAGRTVRPLGSGHSFTAVGAPESPGPGGATALDLSEWTGIVHANHTSGLVTVRAGTPLHQLNAELDRHGLAMANLGDIDRQTVAGALATGTHGTGSTLGGLATQVVQLEIILADGSTRTCSPRQNPDLFEAARLGLGALGVLSTVTLRCVPAFALAADERPEPLDSVLERFDELAASNDHFEFYWFPHGENALVKRNNRLPGEAEPKPLSPVRHFFEYEVMENWAFGALCGIGHRVRPLARPLNRLSGAVLSPRSYSDRSHRVFVTSRKVRFVECEYAVPVESLRDVVKELRLGVGRLRQPVVFPVEIRVAAPDDVWLSTAYQRDSAYIAVHQYVRMPYQEWFDTFESIVDKVAGRPHWGKMHRLGARHLRERYPRYDDFLRVRADVDPGGVFRNPYLDRVLGS